MTKMSADEANEVNVLRNKDERAITQRFVDEYRKYTANVNNDSPNNLPLANWDFEETYGKYVNSIISGINRIIPPQSPTSDYSSFTIDEWKIMLKEIGIENGKQLGSFFGLSDRQGQNLYKNPRKLRLKHLILLRNKVQEAELNARVWQEDLTQALGYSPFHLSFSDSGDRWELDPNCKEGATPQDASAIDVYLENCPDGYPLILKKALSTILSERGWKTRDLIEATCEEYRLRALERGFKYLNEEDKKTLLYLLMTMLKTKEDAEADELARSLESTDCGPNADDIWLVSLINEATSREEEQEDGTILEYINLLPHLSSAETGGIYRSSNAVDLILRQYVGISPDMKE